MPWNLELGDWSALGEDVYIYSLGRVHVGSRTTVSYRSHLCAGTHDLTNPKMPLLRPPIEIGDNVWMGTEAFIGPGVTVGDGAIIGARAVVVKDVPPMHIVAGNPARQIGMRSGVE
jgi:putative colanic acid biosynthesis acetyltransferase WcaF